MRILVLNAGSSSLKISLLAGDQQVSSENAPVRDGSIDASALRAAVDRAGDIDAVGHRVVHGGGQFVAPVVIDDGVVDGLRSLIPLAPLHQPLALQAIELGRQLVAGPPHVACFDTAFHAQLPDVAVTYALPEEWRRRWPIRRYGFHGLSHAYASRRAAELIGASDGDMRLVTCHLGAGASLAAVKNGVSIETTMGFTPLEGLVMATRSGSVDPGLVLWLVREGGIPPGELLDALEHRSGLLALAGTADMHEALEAEARGDKAAALAIAVYVHHLTGGIAQMVAALGGVDGIVFTGGVGENAPEVRARAAAGLGYLGVALDSARNDAVTRDADIGAPGSAVRAFAVQAREDVEIARGVRRALREI